MSLYMRLVKALFPHDDLVNLVPARDNASRHQNRVFQQLSPAALPYYLEGGILSLQPQWTTALRVMEGERTGSQSSLSFPMPPEPTQLSA